MYQHSRSQNTEQYLTIIDATSENSETAARWARLGLGKSLLLIFVYNFYNIIYDKFMLKKMVSLKSTKS